MRKEEKLKQMQPFELSGEMTVLLPNDIRIEISSKDPNRIVAVYKRQDKVIISDAIDGMKVNTEFSNRMV